MDNVRVLRVVSLLEATSFLILLLCSVLKRTSDFNAVPVMGAVHGVLFIAYVALAFMSRPQTRWSNGRMALALVAAVLPVAPYFVERRWLRPIDEAAAARGA